MLDFLSVMLAGIPEHLVILFEIGIMIIVAGVFAFILRLMRQPLIPAYILTGILLGPLFLGLIQNTDLVLSLSEIGVAFLLFFAGMEISFKKLKEVGGVATIVGVVQIVALFVLGFFIAGWLGFVSKEALYIGLVVAFSSTMVVVKLLSDKRQLDTLHGRIILGILLVQDIAAILALIFLSSGANGLSFAIIGSSLLRAGIFVIFAFILAKISNPIFRVAAVSTELILLVAIAFLFLFAIGSYLSGLSLIIGAFLAGVALSNSDFKIEIQGGIEPLRDFFAIIFFVALGMQLIIFPKSFLPLFLILIGLTIILKPLIIMVVTRISGYTKRTSFLTGISLAQTSEFSLIILVQGLMLAHIGNGIFSTLVLLTIVTMSLTSYIIRYDNKLFNAFSFPLNLFKRISSKKEKFSYIPRNKNKIILIGCHRMGSLFLGEFSKMKKNMLIVDYDPMIIRSLINKKYSCIYGDFANKEVLQKIGLEDAEMVISTVPDLEDNLLLINKVKAVNLKAVIFVTAGRISEAERLYDAGADYVTLPHMLSGKMSADLVKSVLKNKKSVKKIKKDSIESMEKVHHLLYK